MELSYEAVSNQGERVLEGDREELVQEHISRYQFAVRYISTSPVVAPGLVLDCACGSGYGTAVLAKKAETVVGIDISDVAIDYARNHYRQKNVAFQVGSAEDLPVSTDSVELFISFETIEHV